MEENVVRYIAKNLVNKPDEVNVRRIEKGRTVILKLNVASEDMGRVIGKNGRVANAVRALLRAANDPRSRQRIVLDIE
jgi:hypothetical protein